MELSDARYDELLEQATLDCYDEEEEFTGVLCTLEDELAFPLDATLAGVPVVVRGLDSQRSSLRRGIVAVVEREGERFTASLADLTPVDPDPATAEWLAMHRRWADML